MAKGKYAARAANRLAQTDNELLIEEVAKRKQAELERDQVALELQLLRSKMSTEIIRGASEQSRKLVSEARAEYADSIAGLREEYARSGIRIADRLWSYFVGPSKTGMLPSFFVTDVVPALVPEAEVNEFLNSRLDEQPGESPANREARRHAMENIRRATKVRSGNNQHPESVTGLLAASALGDESARQALIRRTGGDGVVEEA